MASSRRHGAGGNNNAGVFGSCKLQTLRAQMRANLCIWVYRLLHNIWNTQTQTKQAARTINETRARVNGGRSTTIHNQKKKHLHSHTRAHKHRESRSRSLSRSRGDTHNTHSEQPQQPLFGLQNMCAFLWVLVSVYVCVCACELFVCIFKCACAPVIWQSDTTPPQ